MIGPEKVGEETAVHRIEWTHDEDRTTARVVCDAPEGADCRLTCDEGCEEWTIERDESGPFHSVCTLEDDLRHDMRDMGECNVALYLNEGECIEEMRSGDPSPIVVGSVSVIPVWEGGYYSWRVSS